LVVPRVKILVNVAPKFSYCWSEWSIPSNRFDGLRSLLLAWRSGYFHCRQLEIFVSLSHTKVFL